MDDQRLMTDSVNTYAHTHTKRKTAIKYIKNCPETDKKRFDAIEMFSVSICMIP